MEKIFSFESIVQQKWLILEKILIIFFLKSLRKGKCIFHEKGISLIYYKLSDYY